MTLKDKLLNIRAQIAKKKHVRSHAAGKDQSVTLTLPTRFSTRDHNIYDFDTLLGNFDWTLTNKQVRIDLRDCKSANYQAISLLVLYGWSLKNQGCIVSFIESEGTEGASEMWRKMGARGTFPILFNENQMFKGDPLKPLFAVRNINDFKIVVDTAASYTKGFNVEYAETLRYLLGELLYNTLEHGRWFGTDHVKKIRMPSLVQFTWYKKNNEIHFIIADNGVGVKCHIEQTYPGQESHEDAIKLAIKSQISGTFRAADPYKQKNNAGMGLYISSNIIRKLNADMHVVSGNGLVHISPKDITGKTLKNSWPGTFVLVTIKLEENSTFILHKIMQEFRDAAMNEQRAGNMQEQNGRYYLSIFNYFGKYAEDKEAAIRFRDKRIFLQIEAGKTIIVDFDNTTSAPHSFLSALLASPIKTLGLVAHKRIKIVNATPEIRETIDFIFDDNT
jgi:hypothetical protein